MKLGVEKGHYSQEGRSTGANLAQFEKTGYHLREV
jgi:hypothetical protein